MGKLITHNANALRFLMTEDIYDLGDALDSATPQPAPITILTNEDRKLPLVEDIPAEMKPLSFDYLGENNRYFLVIVDDKTHPSLNSTHKEMLMKIMAAKKLELRDLAILNFAKYPNSTFSDLKDFFSCNRITLFGIDPQRLGLPAIGANQPARHEDVKVLATFGLEEMSSNTDKKREFWNVMKDF
ncbi:hypothetical protein [Daejeonella lutea]|uniref:Uncharacterized protein n=1 Tax=Daejeonella lutea TaxID=572036 RepID=A0A1T5CV44_9SPHI|nr:hypothetical protein [Daejeonella lutea]SKB63329.1 hypothetical protein SAMN05661099_1911 [Daejeonella lutea]